MTDSYALDRSRPTLTVDVIISNNKGEVLMIRRGTTPFEGSWCLPGGLVDPGETVEAAAIREVQEETGLEVSIGTVVGIYSESGRDPRGHYVTIAVRAESVKGDPKTTLEATEIAWKDPRKKLEMGFDHARIIADHLGDNGSRTILA